MSWMWIGTALSVPVVLGLLVAIPIWLKWDVLIGNVIATGVILLSVVLLIGREYIDLERQACIETGVPCTITPADFIR